MTRQPSRPRLPARAELIRDLDGTPNYATQPRQRWPRLMTPQQVAHRLRLDDDAMTAPPDQPDRP